MTSLPEAIIVDLDGTLAIKGDRSPYDCAKADLDSLNPTVFSVMLGYIGRTGAVPIITSGRKSENRHVTESWLTKHGVPYLGLFMRPEGDVRKDSIVKQELYEQHIAPNWCVSLVLDDRKQVVDMWRALGLTCFQVAAGDF
jgi:hypothetical protein